MRAIKFLEGLFWYETELPMLFVIKKCAERFGSLDEGLYVVADAISNGDLIAIANDQLTLAKTE